MQHQLCFSDCSLFNWEVISLVNVCVAPLSISEWWQLCPPIVSRGLLPELKGLLWGLVQNLHYWEIMTAAPHFNLFFQSCSHSLVIISYNIVYNGWKKSYCRGLNFSLMFKGYLLSKTNENMFSSHWESNNNRKCFGTSSALQWKKAKSCFDSVLFFWGLYNTPQFNSELQIIICINFRVACF